MWDTIICIIGVPEEEKKICEKTMAKDIPDLMKNLIYRSKKFNEFQVG